MNLCNINIKQIDKSNLFILSDSLKVIIPINAESIVRCNQDPDLLRLVNKYNTTIDGQIPLWIFKLQHTDLQVVKLSGSDLISDLCAFCNDNGLRIFFLGGKETSNLNSIIHVKKSFMNILIDGYSPPYENFPFSDQNETNIFSKISEFRPHVLAVGFGFGKQELWVHNHYSLLNKLGIKLVLCCGGTFEFLSGELRRAPVFIQKIGLESLWRFLMEPKLFRIKRIYTSMKIFKYINYDSKK